MAFGALTTTSVMEYFAQSPFYDPTSNNAVLRMQTQFSMDPGSGVNEAEELKRFVGVEFAVTHSDPPSLFVIEKRDRLGPSETRAIACYYVLNNSIYQAPDLYSVLSNRLLSSLFYMQSSLATAREKKSDFTPRTGGNRYRVTKPDENGIELGKLKLTDVAGGPPASAVVAVEGEKEEQEHKEKDKDKAKQKKSTTNLDFLLARALQTTVRGIQAEGSSGAA